MIKITEKLQCCGCGACVQKCPKQSIILHEDNEGFLYPHGDKKTCIECGLCEKVCPILNPYETRVPLQVFSAINKNEKIRMESSSGGIFTLLAEPIIREGGVVFGARFDEEWQVTLDYTETIEGLAAFRGSKYVQARTGDTYKQCEKFLKEGRKVLFTGTPCQIAGLNHFLRKQYDNLTTCDFVCHGIPSPKVWRMYLKEVIAGANKSITDIKFRNKDNGWKTFNFKLSYNEQTKETTLSSYHYDNIYMRAFLSDMILRPSCHDCKAKNMKSGSDITIADYWGINNIHPEMDDDKGTGLVLIHTQKGKDALDLSKTTCLETTFESGVKYNPAIYRSAIAHVNRGVFFEKLDTTEDLCQLVLDCATPTFIQKVKAYLMSPNRIIKKIQKTRMGGGDDNLTNDYDIIYPSAVELKSIQNISFRDKRNGWKTYQIVIDIR